MGIEFVYTLWSNWTVHSRSHADINFRVSFNIFQFIPRCNHSRSHLKILIIIINIEFTGGVVFVGHHPAVIVSTAPIRPGTSCATRLAQTVKSVLIKILTIKCAKYEHGLFCVYDHVPELILFALYMASKNCCWPACSIECKSAFPETLIWTGHLALIQVTDNCQ